MDRSRAPFARREDRAVTDLQSEAALGVALFGDPGRAVVYAEASGRIGFWNAGATALFGYSVTDVAGRRVDILVPPEHRERHWAGFHRAIGSAWPGSDGWGPVGALCKDGSRREVEVFLCPVREGGRVKGILAMFRLPSGPGA
jgi:PAS domain S-box-containing protein